MQRDARFFDRLDAQDLYYRYSEADDSLEPLSRERWLSLETTQDLMKLHGLAR